MFLSFVLTFHQTKHWRPSQLRCLDAVFDFQSAIKQSSTILIDMEITSVIGFGFFGNDSYFGKNRYHVWSLKNCIEKNSNREI